MVCEVAVGNVDARFARKYLRPGEGGVLCHCGTRASSGRQHGSPELGPPKQTAECVAVESLI
jgi:hypothetical protein